MAKLGALHSVSLLSGGRNGLLPAQYKTHDRLIAQASLLAAVCWMQTSVCAAHLSAMTSLVSTCTDACWKMHASKDLSSIIIVGPRRCCWCCCQAQ